jgi:predicted negative regulator of RcsB-dependent stress response
LTLVAGTPLQDNMEVTVLTAPGLTLLFLGVVVGLGIAFVWMLWEVEQVSKPRRNSDRFG